MVIYEFVYINIQLSFSDLKMSKDIKRADVIKSVDILRARQQHPTLSEFQIKTVVALVGKQNSLNQLPTGSGKTWPVVCFPQILDILRETFHYDDIPSETRVLYIVPLINIYHSLSKEMKSLNIPYQIMGAGGSTEVTKEAKVIFISPERLLNKSVMTSIMQLHWSCVSIDEPHLALEWGISKTKRSKPFREAFTKLNSLNILGTVFEMHSATIENKEQLYQLVGRKFSPWENQLVVPERSNLTYFLFTGTDAPNNILQLPSILKCLDAEEPLQGITLVYVQSIKEGSDIYLTLLDYCEKKNLISFPTDKARCNCPVLFLHSNLTEEKKAEVMEEAMRYNIKILVATSAAGAGINLPVVQFVGWGLDRQPSGIIQSQGRTARYPYQGEGIVIWVHKPKLHGRRLDSSSKVRKLLEKNCFRKTINSWFNHDLPNDELSNPPEVCCSNCMALCMENSDCQRCKVKMEQFSPKFSPYNSDAVKVLTNFLKTLSLNQNLPESAPRYSEESMSQEIVRHITDSEDSKLQGTLTVQTSRREAVANETIDFLKIFSVGETLTQKIGNYINLELIPMLTISPDLSSECTGECASDTSSESCSSSKYYGESDEYFDSENEIE